MIPAYLGGERLRRTARCPRSSRRPSTPASRAARSRRRSASCATIKRPWIDSGQEHGYEDVFTIAQIGDLEVKLHAAEALLEARGPRDRRDPRRSERRERSATTAVKVAEAKVADDRDRHSGDQQAARARRHALDARPSTISTGIGATPAPIRCTTRCAGNISTSAIISSTACARRATPGADAPPTSTENLSMPAALATLDAKTTNSSLRHCCAARPARASATTRRRSRVAEEIAARLAQGRLSATAIESCLTRKWS